jgi:hypothetical protein
MSGSARRADADVVRGFGASVASGTGACVVVVVEVLGLGEALGLGVATLGRARVRVRVAGRRRCAMLAGAELINSNAAQASAMRRV